MAYASAGDVRDLMEPDVGTVLSSVEAIIKSRIPDLDERVAASADYRARVVAVESAAAARVMRNPSGLQQEAESSYSYSMSARAASGYVMITDEEWSWLGVGAGIKTVAPAVSVPNVDDDVFGWQYNA